MANPFDRLSLAQLRQRQSLKWRAYPPDVLPLWVAEMDTLPAEPVRAALVAALDRGDTGYPWGSGYVEAVAGYAATHWDWRPDPAGMSLVADVMTGVAELLTLLTGPGDAVVLVPPVYPPFFAAVEHLGRRLLLAPLDAGGRLDFDALEQACSTAAAGGRRAVLVLCNPHNPTGTVHTRAELTAVADLATRTGVRVVADEIHAPLVYPHATDGGVATPFTPYLSVPGAERGFAVFSASKGWNLAGLKAAVLIAGPAARDELAAVPELVSHGASSLGVLAHTVALVSGQDWLAEHLRGLDAQRRLLVQLLADALPEVAYEPPAGTYLAWLDCRPLALPEEPATFFLEQAKVALGAGPDFGPGGAGHVRLNLATSTEVLTTAVEQMAAAVADRRTRPLI